MNTKKLAQELAILPQSPESESGLLVEELVSYGHFPYQNDFGNLSTKDHEMIDWTLEATNTAEFKIDQWIPFQMDKDKGCGL